MYKPTIHECIEGSYKEGFELLWRQIGDTIEIQTSSVSRPWRYYRDGIEANILRDIAEHYPELKVKWI